MAVSGGSSPLDGDRYRRWVAAWSETVRAAPTAIGLVDLQTARVLVLSPRAAVILGRSPDERGEFDVLSMHDRRDEVATATRLLSEGSVNGLATRRHLRRPDGSAIEVTSYARAVRSSLGPALSLWVLSPADPDTGPGEGTVSTELIVEALPRPAAPDADGARLGFGIVDDRWQVIEAEPAAGDLLERRPDELIGTAMAELTHPDDVGAMLLAAAATTTDPNALVSVRVQRSGGAWLPVTVVVTMIEADDGPRFQFSLTLSEASEGTQYDSRVEQLEQRLRRISAEVEAAGVVGTLAGSVDLMALPALRDLSSRQWEVLTRLVRGERVQMIASEMHLSSSTVRNHLAAIYRKIGVHSQHELLAVLRGAQATSTSR